MPDSKFNPHVNTSTVADLTKRTQDVALDGWIREDLKPGQRYGPYYHTGIGDWQPLREFQKGRWASPEKPINKHQAHLMYALGHLDQSLPWKLYTFYLVPTEPTWIFRSKVKEGTSEQIKLPNHACPFIQIESEEPLP